MQLGFVIDHSRCIGCHACTVACKSENDVPVGSFRTWVKYTEQGSFPEVRRSFAVLRCNQCTNPPCVTICPVNALAKRPDGVIDVDPHACIGCKSCMQGCPYDALYIHPGKGTAQKCHFCVHRTERGLAPACAIVCPTEAIIPGDFDDPQSVVAKLRATGDLQARKTEAGTGPNVFYRDVTAAGIEPLRTNAASGSIWADTVPGAQLDAATFEALEKRAEARTVYDVQHPPLWGWRVGAYLFTKSLAAGAFLVMTYLSIAAAGAPGARDIVGWGWQGALLFLGITLALLVADLKRPERFLYILTRPNWSSWLTRGGVILGLYGMLLLSLAFVTLPAPLDWLRLGVTVVTAVLTAIYTAWLFGQAKGRVLWLRRLLAPHLLVHAWVAGSAWMLIGASIWPDELWHEALRTGMLVGLGLQAAFVLSEHRFAPRGREAEYERAVRLVTHGPFARRHWTWGVGVGIVVPFVLILFVPEPRAVFIAAVLALGGLWTEEDILVRAGQAPAIS